MRPQLAKAVADHDLNGSQNLDESACSRLADDAGLVNGPDKRRRAAVHDRYFGTVDFDGGVVDAHATQCGKHMFGGRNKRPFGVPQDGSEFGRDHGIGGGLDLAVAALEARAYKNETCIHGCRSDGETYGQTGMYAITRYGCLRPKRCLPAQFHQRSAHHRLYLKPIGTTSATESFFKYPQVAATIVTAPKCANSRFFTDCYPISAVLAPPADQTLPPESTFSTGPRFSGLYN